MSYSLNQLLTKADCQAVLDQVADDRSRLVFRQTVANRSQDISTSSASHIAADLAVANANISLLTTLIPTLPASDQPARTLEKRKFERQRDALTDRQQSGGAVALVERELEAKLVDLQLAEVDVFIAAVQARQAALPS